MSASKCFCLRLCPLKVRHQRGKIVQRLRPRDSPAGLVRRFELKHSVLVEYTEIT